MRSKITLFAAQTGATKGWTNVPELEFTGTYSPQQQQQNRNQNKTSREKTGERVKDTRQKIILGGILLKFFPELKELDPTQESDFRAVAGIFASLASEPEFLTWWAAKMKKS